VRIDTTDSIFSCLTFGRQSVSIEEDTTVPRSKSHLLSGKNLAVGSPKPRGESCAKDSIFQGVHRGESFGLLLEAHSISTTCGTRANVSPESESIARE
jgi:hypothetical protein